jgi:hypothetical protein
VEPPKNVVPFPLTSDVRTPSLSAIENHAFDEIARRLTQKIDGRQESSAHDQPESRNQRAATAQGTGCCLI